jgi:hypothetical protein
MGSLSLLEAFNAGHMNTQPLSTRWMCGIVPRCGREVIFGIGLNQLSDYCEERVGFVTNPVLRTATASIFAGNYTYIYVQNYSVVRIYGRMYAIFIV